MAIKPTKLSRESTFREAAGRRDLLERELGIREREYGRDHPEVAVTLVNLGGAYGDIGDAAKACDLVERALAIFEREYGRDHLKVAATLTNLGVAYGDLGDAAKKRVHLERALAIFEREYGPYHREVAATLTNLGVAYGTLGNASKARDLLERALAIEEREYGRDHSEVALTRDLLGNGHYEADPEETGDSERSEGPDSAREEVAELRVLLEQREKELAAKRSHAEQLEALIEKETRSELLVEGGDCVVCFAQRREIAFNCGHFVCCVVCGPRCPTCPFCEKPVTTRTRILRTQE